MTRSIRWAAFAACCGLIALLMQGGSSTLASTPVPYAYPLPCGGGCICIPNVKHFGYFPTTWRQWPDEPRPEVTFPQSVGIETIPAPAGQELPPPEAVPETILTPEEGLLPPDEPLPIDRGTPEAPIEPEATPPAGTAPLEALPGLPKTLPGLPVSPDSILPDPSEEDNLPAKKPIEIPAEEPVEGPFEREPAGNPFDMGDDGTYQPYFMPHPPVPVSEEPPPPAIAGSPSRGPSDPPEKLADLEPPARPLHEVVEENPEQHEDLPSPAPAAELLEESIPESAPTRLLQDDPPDARPLRELAEEFVASAAPLRARVNEPQSLAARGETIVEPTLSAPPQQPEAARPNHAEIDPPGHAKIDAPIDAPGHSEIEPASPPEMEPPRANWALALNAGFRGGSAGTLLVGRPVPSVSSEAPQKNDSAGFSNSDFVLALDGYCPVELIEKERWTPGNSGLSAVYHGQTFFFSNLGARGRFLADPERYSPAYEGRDPVLLVQGRRVPGHTDYCITCNGRLYAFSCEETLQQFRQGPQKYVVSDSDEE